MNNLPLQTNFYYESEKMIYYITNDSNEIKVISKEDKGKDRTSSWFLINKKYITQTKDKNIFDLVNFKNDFMKFDKELPKID